MALGRRGAALDGGDTANVPEQRVAEGDDAPAAFVVPVLEKLHSEKWSSRFLKPCSHVAPRFIVQGALPSIALDVEPQPLHAVGPARLRTTFKSRLLRHATKSLCTPIFASNTGILDSTVYI